MKRAVLVAIALAACSEPEPDPPWQPSWGRAFEVGPEWLDGVAASASGDVFVSIGGWLSRWSPEAPTWTELAPPGDIGAIRLAVDGEGSALAIGRGQARGFVGRRLPAGAPWPDGWQTETIVPLPPVDREPELGELVMTERGAAALAWRDLDAATGSRGTSRVALRLPSGLWTEPVLLGGSARDVAPLLALAEVGGALRLVAAWTVLDGDAVRVEADVYTLQRGTGQGAWQGTTVLIDHEPVDGTPTSIELGIDRDGRASLLARSRHAVRLVRYTGAWEAPIEVHADDVDLRFAALAADPDGPVLVAWARCPDGCELQARRWLPAGLEPAVTLADPTRLAARPRLAASGGRALATWGDGPAVMASEWGDGAWTAAHELGRVEADTVLVSRVTLAAGGAGAVAWTDLSGAGERTWVATYAP